MGSDNLWIGDPTSADTVTTTQYHQLGQLYVEPPGFGGDRDPAVTGSKADRGRRVWIYCYNDSGVALVAGSVLARKALTTTYNVKKAAVNTHACAVVGVAQQAVADVSYFWAVREGVCEVLADAGGVTAELGLIVGDAIGTADAAAAVTDASFGVAHETAASALATCTVNCRG